MSSVDPENDPAVNPNYPGAAPWHGSSGLTGAVAAWGGACFNIATERLRLDAAGGHSDYAGNASYEWVLNTASPYWKIIGKPSGAIGSPAINFNDGNDANGVYLNDAPGKVRAQHGYSGCIYVPNVGTVITEQVGMPPNGVKGRHSVITFDQSTGFATQGSITTGSGNGTSICATFDPSRGAKGVIWCRRTGSSIIQKYDVASDTLVNVGGATVWNGDCSLTYLPSLDCILVGNGEASGQSVTGGWCVFDCTTYSYYFPTFTGAPAINSPGVGGLWPGSCQPEWVPSLGAACAWDNDTQLTQITRLTPGANPRTDNWTITTMPVTGGVTPSAAQAAGTYGRWRYWPGAGGFVLLNSYNAPGYFYKL